MLLCIGLVFPSVCMGPAGSSRALDQHAYERQDFDAPLPEPRPDQAQYVSAELDVASQTIDFGIAAVNRLQTRGEATLELPGMTPITLVKTRQQSLNGMVTMTLKQMHTTAINTPELVSTLTRRGDSFFLSLATARGGYRVEGRGSHSQITPNRVLAQRLIRHEADYRYAH